MSIETALEKLTEHGYRATTARRVVLKALAGHNAHLTSAEVLERVNEIDASVSRASVFRALELFTTLAIVRPVHLEARTPTYMLTTADGHHSHMVCTRCGEVLELDDCYVEDAHREIEARYGVRVMGHLLEFYGLCADCGDIPTGT